MNTWDLTPLFPDFDSKEFKDTVAEIEGLIKDSKAFADTLSKDADAVETIKKYLTLASKLRSLFVRAYGYCNLRLATNAQDETSQAWMNKMGQMSAETTKFSTAFIQWLDNVDNLEELIENNDSLKPYRYHLLRAKSNAAYMLSEKEEQIIAKMKQTGSDAWSRQQGMLTSMLDVEYEGETITLSAVRNKAHSPDAGVRKKAYEAELAAYKKIEQSIAFSLNSIKGEVNELVKLRGYESPLHESVYNARMQQKTLDALLESMREHRPMFHQYLRRKAKMLGHEGGLPWYDLFAPLGKSEREFSIDDAMQYVIKNFASYSDDLANLAKRAYDEEWIDFTPRKGKRGGAFCFNIHPLKQSRILTNFDGSFSNVITLAHELGHAYHGERIFEEEVLNASYTMPVAETASTLCETIVKKAAIKDAKDEEKLFILEQSLMGTTQVIVDILSRFIFEQNVFKVRENTPIPVEKLKTMMEDAQKEAYGDGIDQDKLHPYMWINKPHYYSGGLSFYNFPYAFGLLFAKGIYALYQEKGSEFVPEIDKLLQMTGKMDVEDVAQMVGIDVTKREFWDKSLAVVKEEIDMFMELTE